MKRYWLIAILMLGMVVVAEVPAKNKTKREIQVERRKAIDLLDEGMQLMEKQDYSAAIDKLEASRTILKSPMVLYLMAQCFEKVGKLEIAEECLVEAIKESPEFSDAKRDLKKVRVAIIEKEKAIAIAKSNEKETTKIDPVKVKDKTDSSNIDETQIAKDTTSQKPDQKDEVKIKDAVVIAKDLKDPKDATQDPKIITGDGSSDVVKTDENIDSVDENADPVNLDTKIAKAIKDIPAIDTKLTSGNLRITTDLDIDPMDYLLGNYIPENISKDQDIPREKEPWTPPAEMENQQLVAILFPPEDKTFFEEIRNIFVGSPDKIYIDTKKTRKYIADQFRDKKMWTRAAAEYFDIIQKHPDDMDSWLALGECLAKSGRTAKADGVYKRSREKFSTHYKPFFESGVFYRRTLKDLESAVGYYKQALKLDPAQDESYNHLGITYMNLDQLDNAAEIYKKGIEHNPKFSRYYINAGIVYEKKKEPEEAVKYYKLYLENGGDNPEKVERWIREIEGQE